MQTLMFSSVVPPASHSALRDSEAVWQTTAAHCPSSSFDWLIACAPAGWFGRTSPVSCHRMKDGTLAPSSGGWQNSGMGGPTECLTLNTTEWPSAAVVCSLSDVLEDGPGLQPYFLSARACAGILRRAAKRGKKLPARLEAALRAVVGATTPTG